MPRWHSYWHVGIIQKSDPPTIKSVDRIANIVEVTVCIYYETVKLIDLKVYFTMRLNTLATSSFHKK